MCVLTCLFLRKDLTTPPNLCLSSNYDHIYISFCLHVDMMILHTIVVASFIFFTSGAEIQQKCSLTVRKYFL